MDELRLTLLGIGGVIVIAIYLWGMRRRIKSGFQERRHRATLRSPENEPVLNEQVMQEELLSLEPLPKGDGLDDRRLVDVEIRRVDTPHAQVSTVPSQEPKIFEPKPKVSEPKPKTFELKPKVSEPKPKTLEPKPKVSEPRAQRQEPKALEPKPKAEMAVLLTVMASENQPFKGLKILEAAQEFDLKLSKNGVLDCLSDSEQIKGKPVFSIAHLREPGIFDLDTVGALSTPGLLMFLQLPGPVEELAAVDLMMAMAGQLARFLGGTVCDERRNKLTTQTTVQLRSKVAEFQRSQRLS